MLETIFRYQKLKFVCMVSLLFALHFVEFPLTEYVSIRVAFGFYVLIAAMYPVRVTAIIGLLTHLLYDSLTHQNIWISWGIGTCLVGMVLGKMIRRTRLTRGDFHREQAIRFMIVQTAANIFIWGIVTPCLQLLFAYNESTVAFQQGWIAGITNAITIGVIGLPLLFAYSKRSRWWITYRQNKNKRV